MKTKTLLSIAIIAALPFAANATQTIVQTQTPAAVGANGTVKKAATTGPYVTNEPTVADQTHIATTAYVKGAYNDAIAAVNKVDDDKQAKLINGQNNNNILPKVLSLSGFNIMHELMSMDGSQEEESELYGSMINDIAADLTGVGHNAAALDDTLISAGTVMQWMRGAGNAIKDRQDKLHNYNSDELQSTTVGYNDILTATDYIIHDTQNAFIGDQAYTDQLVTANEVIDSIKVATNYIGDTIDSKRVRIYTTWGTDTAAATTLVPFEMAQ